ncbi:Neutrophil cytosol factor 2, partial [Irineochytrium annulatum]
GSTVSSLASNPAFQRAALNAASNPAVQKAAYNAASSAASNPEVQGAAKGFATNAVRSQFGGTVGAAGAGAGKKQVVATADFDSKEAGDLGFRTGDVITVLEDVDENWQKGEFRGRQGIFPKSFTRPK